MTQMFRYGFVAIAAALISGFAVHALNSQNREADASPAKLRDIVVSEQSAIVTRRTSDSLEQSTAPNSIREAFTIQNTFDRRTAIRLLAARANSDSIQTLIFDADRIADDNERQATLMILFTRFADLDPRSALKLSRTEFFAGQIELEESIWQRWAANHFNMALSAAAAETGDRARRTAARSLYMVSGFVGTPEAREIELATGVRPDRKVRIAYIQAMANSSLNRAVAFVEGLPNGNSKHEYSAWLAYHVATLDPDESAKLTAMLTDPIAKSFAGQASSRINAQLDPVAAVRTTIALGRTSLNDGSFVTAFRELAASDMPAALALAESLDSPLFKTRAYSIAAASMAAEDPDRALAWARQMDSELGGPTKLENSVVMALARSDPKRGIAEINRMQNSQARSRTLLMTAHLISDSSDPVTAMALMADIENKNDRLQAEQTVLRNWVSKDPEAATQWVMSLDAERSVSLAAQLVPNLAATDPETAISLLPMFKEGKRAQLAKNIGNQMVRNHSIEAALDFAREFDAVDDSGKVQSAVIGAIATFDKDRALALANQTFTGKPLNDTLSKIAGGLAFQDPASAAGVAVQLDAGESRTRVMRRVARHWNRIDPQAAMDWANDLDDVPMRDQTIRQLATNWRTPTAAQTRLIDTIQDPALRLQAYTVAARNLRQSDSRSSAQRLIDNASLTEEQRAEIQRALDDD